MDNGTFIGDLFKENIAVVHMHDLPSTSKPFPWL